MYEVLIESDLTVFVCPCGNQFIEELNFYHHIWLVHKENVFKPCQAMQALNLKDLSSAKLKDFGEVITEFNEP